MDPYKNLILLNFHKTAIELKHAKLLFFTLLKTFCLHYNPHNSMKLANMTPDHHFVVKQMPEKYLAFAS